MKIKDAQVTGEAMSNTIGLGFDPQSGALAKAPLHIPDLNGGAYKTELVLSRSDESTTKINWWHGDDPRPEPHSHPWPFKSEILHGGYTEDRWYGDSDIGWVKTTHVYKAGDVNDCPHGTFHVVRDVLPGTVTKMVCGEKVGDGDWGYLVKSYMPAGRTYVSAREMADPSFLENMREINPHMRPKNDSADDPCP